MTATVVYDANVLYPNTLRDLLIRIGRAGLVHARWTEQILDEMSEALRRNRPDIDESKIKLLRELMNAAIRDCLVATDNDLIESVVLPDKDDRHVLAAAIAASADAIITWNTRDFPQEALAPYGVRAQTPDDLVSDLVCIDSAAVWACVQQIVEARIRRPQSSADVLRQLERDGLRRAAAKLRSIS